MRLHHNSSTFAALAILSCSLISQAAAQEAVVVRQPWGGFAASEPAEVDPTNAKERLLLLAPGGPLILEVEITIDGKPYRTDREAMIDELLKVGDQDKDGAVTWDEVLKSPPKSLGNLVYYASNEQARNQLVKANDKNSDGKLDRYEARLLLANAYAGPTFSMINNSYNQTVSPDVFALLDEDKNDTLSAEEIAKGAEKLASRDRDANDIVDAMELAGTGGAFVGAVRGVGNGIRQAMPLLGMIGHAFNPDEAHQALVARYGAENKLPVAKLSQMPKLAKQLDKNENGEIEKGELAALNEITPHIQLRAALGDIGEEAAPLTLVSMQNDAGERITTETGKGGVNASLPGMRLEMIGGNVNYGGYSYKQTADAMLTQYDTDKNGYIEEKELPTAQAPYFKQQFKTWDADDDGKVFAEEIKKSYDLMARPQNYRASVAAADLGGSLFSAMDTSGDNRLGLREMRTAAERLKAFDKDSDGAVSRTEVPTTIRFAVARGGFAYSLLPMRGGMAYGGGQGGFIVRGGQPQPQKADPLEWFTRMDRNGDGDVTLKEFPGEEEQFKALDSNADGFIERMEAEAVKE
jgi:Ca2+-binding EF-hand superfamily protein